MDYCWIGKLQPHYGNIMQHLAIYDMDKTITARATFVPLLRHVIRYHFSWRILLLPLVLLASIGGALRLVGRKRLKEINLTLLMGQHFDPVALGQAFAAETLLKNILPKALAQIAADKAEGCQLVMATASYAFYVAPIAQALGFDAIVATMSQPGLPARISGVNCYGADKRKMVEAWLTEQGLVRGNLHIRFYSDHVSDAPMFELADVAIAVNAHPPLARLAGEQGWESRDWRD
jgi:HAD superfamily hydrolase (TIGR01490 family)